MILYYDIINEEEKYFGFFYSLVMAFEENFFKMEIIMNLEEEKLIFVLRF